LNLLFVVSYVTLWLLALLQAALAFAILPHLVELRRLIERGSLTKGDQLPTGSPAPTFTAVDSNELVDVTERDLASQAGILLFLSPDCSVCLGLAQSIGRSDVQSLPKLIAFCDGVDISCSEIADRLRRKIPFVLQRGSEVAALYHVSGFPTAVAIDGELKIRGYGHPKDIDDLQRFFFPQYADTC
jgi:hypothetical protein